MIRMFGITAQGNSASLHVHNFTPYFYVKLDSQRAPHFGPEDLQGVRDALNKWVQGSAETTCTPVKAVELIVDKASVMHYQADKAKFLKIYTGLPKYVNQLRTLFENGSFSYKGSNFFETTTFESNLPYALRFMIDNEVVGMSWVRVKAGKYRERIDKLCSTQIELDVEDFNDIECLPCEGDYSKIAPLRILSFDIECSADKGRFPQAQSDPIIQIANIVKVHGEQEPLVRNVFTLNTCAPIVGAQVHSFHSEQRLLQAWRDFLLEVDPDIITGYNIVNFDFPYIINRAAALHMTSYALFGRVRGTYSRIKTNTFSSKALGTRETKDINMEGRV